MVITKRGHVDTASFRKIVLIFLHCSLNHVNELSLTLVTAHSHELFTLPVDNPGGVFVQLVAYLDIAVMSCIDVFYIHFVAILGFKRGKKFFYIFGILVVSMLEYDQRGFSAHNFSFE